MLKKPKPTKETLLDSWGINRTSEQLDEFRLAQENSITPYYGRHVIGMLLRQLPIEEGQDPYAVFADAVKEYGITGVYNAYTEYRLNPIADEIEWQFIVEVTIK